MISIDAPRFIGILFIAAALVHTFAPEKVEDDDVAQRRHQEMTQVLNDHIY